LPEGVAQIGHEIFEETDAPNIPVLLLDLVEPAQLEARAAHGFIRRHAAGEMTIDEPFEMKSEFIVQVRFNPAASDERTKPVRKIGEHPSRCYALSRICEITSLKARQAVISTSRRERPRLVSS
jgi:hypothetical protein